MNPAEVIEQAKADGVTITLGDGTVKASGDREALSRWLPVLREHKAGIVEALRKATSAAVPGAGFGEFATATLATFATDQSVGREVSQLSQLSQSQDPKNEADPGRAYVAAKLQRNPGLRRAVHTDGKVRDGFVTVTVGVRYDDGIAVGDIQIPAERYDPFRLLELIEHFS